MGEDVVFKRREEISVGETGRKKEKGEEKYEGKKCWQMRACGYQ